MSCFARFAFSRVAFLVGMVAVAGCSSSEAPASSEESSSELNAQSYESQLRLATPRYLGQIANGDTKTNFYTNPPRFRAFGFSARGGDEITVDLKSVGGDAMGWITTSGYDVLAFNDDYLANTLDAKVVYKVPVGTPTRPYRIVFRDYDLADRTFTVKLSINVAPVVCTYGGQAYHPGDSFDATDGCNTCTCNANGNVDCSVRACVCNPEQEPWRNYIGTPTTCETIRYKCDDGTRSFRNPCGCGCEQISH